MGQYYKIVNLDKGQYLKPHKFNDGAKLLEFGDGGLTMTALAVLLADGNNRGGGDLRSDNPVIGSWAGDRIVIAGDYADPEKFLDPTQVKMLFERLQNDLKHPNIKQGAAKTYAFQNCNLYTFAEYFFEDISGQVIEALKDDGYLAEQLDSNNRFVGRPDLIIS